MSVFKYFSMQVTQNESKNGCPPADPSHRCAGVNQRFPCCQPWWGQGLARRPPRPPASSVWLVDVTLWWIWIWIWISWPFTISL